MTFWLHAGEVIGTGVAAFGAVLIAQSANSEKAVRIHLQHHF